MVKDFMKDHLFNVINLMIMICGFSYGFGSLNERVANVERNQNNNRLEEVVGKLADTVSKDHDVLVRVVTQLDRK